MSTPSRGRPPRKQARRGPRPSSLMDQAELLPQSPDDPSYGTGPFKREGPRQLDGHRAPINRQSTPRSHAPRPQAARPKAPQPKASQATVIPSKQPETVTTTGAPKFSDFKGLSPKLLQAIPYPTCSEVQAATLPAILSGKDVLAQAKTGTGKTMGFLIPAIQQLISSPRQNGISTLIISPTRELAQQIGQEAQMLLKGLIGSSFNVKVAVGGTNVRTDVKAVEERRIDILVATPGRAIDLLNQSTLANKLSQTRMLVLDEADRLLDQGFKRDLTTIIGHVPASRQTLLFSATMPNEVKSIAAAALKPNHENISTVSGDEPGVHEHVKQELVIAQHNESLAATYFAIQREREKNPNAKVIVFLSTARGTQLFYQLFQNLDDSFPSYEIHSRMSQPRRTRMTQDFKDSQRGVLFSSDVAARGIDIKDIAAVIQVGAASSSEQYIHRLGRTARAGAEGHGVLIISDSEKYFLRQKTINELDFHPIPIGPEGEIRPVIERIDRAMDKVDRSLKAQVYSAWLGYYKTSLSAMKMTPADLVKSANDYAREVLRFGPQPPGLLAKTVGKMGLKGVPGLRIVKQLEEE